MFRLRARAFETSLARHLQGRRQMNIYESNDALIQAGNFPGPDCAVDAARRDPVHVWLVDDNKNFRALVAEYLGSDEGLRCTRQFSSAEAVLDALSREAPPD